MADGDWEVVLHEGVTAWLRELRRTDPATVDLVVAAVEILEMEGPALGRPLVDHVKASKHKNMKELRPGSEGRSEIRILFAFDPDRKAILLLGGDKAGNWHQWYRKNIKIADERFTDHLAAVRPSGGTTPKGRGRR